MPASSWIVVKFGGTSVSSLESWRTIARVVAERRREGLRPLVVCSAVAGVTDELARLLDEAASGDSAPVLEGIRARHQALGEALEVDASALDEELRELARLASG
ncbi:MAG TPA: bifunctional aspartate kinase/diaminopimelate decarboxylase, partial [Myxococcales bacterium]|nr:bifunctional aspartate kinase/diaminopimelate decarboxylase [Myxococcales bacterium]